MQMIEDTSSGGETRSMADIRATEGTVGAGAARETVELSLASYASDSLEGSSQYRGFLSLGSSVSC